MLSVEKREIFLSQKKIRKINSLVTILVKLLVSRIFVKKVWEKISVHNFHNTA